MNRRPLHRLVVWTLLIVGALPLAACAGETTAGDTQTSAASEQWQEDAAAALAATLSDTGIPGGAIEIRHDGVTGSSAAGLSDVADDTAVSVDDRFAYRSITKSFTGTAVLILVGDGLIGLDDPVSDYVASVPSGDEITIRMLLAMRSGLANYSATDTVQQLLGADPTRTWTDDELLSAAFAEPLSFTPGTSYQYSNTNTVLLGKVLEQVTGQSWSEVVDEKVLQPLGLSGVAYDADRSGSPTFALPYAASADAAPDELPEISDTLFSAAGGLSGTVSELFSWAQTLGEGTLLDADTAAARVADPSSTSSDEQSPLYDAYGLGIGILDGWVGHTGVGVGYQALAMYDPGTGDTVAIVLNGTGDDPDVPAKLFQQLVAAWSAQ